MDYEAIRARVRSDYSITEEQRQDLLRQISERESAAGAMSTGGGFGFPERAKQVARGPFDLVRQAVGRGASRFAGSLGGGLSRVAEAGVDLAFPGRPMRDASWAPSKGWEAIESGINELTGDPQTRFGTVGAVGGTIGGEIGSLVTSGAAARGSLAKAPRAAGAVGRIMSRIPTRFLRRTAGEVAAATPYNLGNAQRRQDTFAGAVTDLTEGQEGPVLSRVHGAAGAMDAVQERLGTAGRFAGETAVDLALSAPLNAVGEGVRTARAIPRAKRIAREEAYRVANTFPEVVAGSGANPGVSRPRAPLQGPGQESGWVDETPREPLDLAGLERAATAGRLESELSRPLGVEPPAPAARLLPELAERPGPGIPDPQFNSPRPPRRPQLAPEIGNPIRTAPGPQEPSRSLVEQLDLEGSRLQLERDLERPLAVEPRPAPPPAIRPAAPAALDVSGRQVLESAPAAAPGIRSREAVQRIERMIRGGDASERALIQAEVDKAAGRQLPSLRRAGDPMAQRTMDEGYEAPPAGARSPAMPIPTPTPGGLNSRVPAARSFADEYIQARRPELADDYPRDPKYLPLPEEEGKAIADAFDAAKHDPDSPEVKASYDAFKRETRDQWDFLAAKGVKFEPWMKEGQPYANSAEMVKDVQENGHLYFFLTDEGFGSTDAASQVHPLLEKAGVNIAGKDLTYNDLFRAVHDYFGHSKEGFQFGPRGEHNAWAMHSAMYTPEARGAMGFETRAQNSWANFGKHLRNEKGEIPKKGEPGYVPLEKRPFAEQKAGILPPQYQKVVADLEKHLRSPEAGAALNELVASMGLGAVGAAAGATEGEDLTERGINALKGGLGMFGLSLAAFALGGKMDEVGAALNPFGRTDRLSGSAFRDPEAYGALLLHRNGQRMGKKAFAAAMEEKFGQGSVAPNIYDKSLAFYKQRLKEVLSPRSEPMMKLDEMLELANQGAGHGAGDWYAGVREVVHELFGQEDGDMFIRFLAATSPQSQATTSNISFAMKAFRQWKLGMTVSSGIFPDPVKGATGMMLQKAVRGETFGGPKIQNYLKALMGDEDAVVIDQWMSRIFGWGDKVPTDRSYAFAEQTVRELAEQAGTTPRQMQASLWGGLKKSWEMAGRTRADTVEPYIGPLMRKLLEDAEFVRFVKGARDDKALGDFAERIAKKGQEAGFATREIIQELVAIGLGGTVGAAAADENKLAGAAIGATLASPSGRAGVRAVSRAASKLPGATPVAEGTVATILASKAATEDDQKKAAALWLMAGVAGAQAVRDTGILRGLDAKPGELLVDKVLTPSADFVKSWVWEKSPAAGQFFFPRHTLGQQYKDMLAVRDREISEARMVADELWKKITGFGDKADEVMSHLIDEGADYPSSLKKLQDAGIDDAEGAARTVAEIHGLFGGLGNDLVRLQLMSNDAFSRWTGKYAPRLYKSMTEMTDRLAGEGDRLRLNATERLKFREEPDNLKGDQLHSAKTRTALGVVQESHLAATERFFQTVGGNAKWVDQESLTAQRSLRTARAARRKAADAGDKDEVYRLTSEIGKYSKDLEAAGKKLDQEAWVQLPESDKLGSLSGTWVRKDLALDIDNFADLPVIHGKAVKFYLEALRAWKTGKTVLNPATHGRNIVSAQLLSWMGDGPAPFGGTWQQALHEVRKGKGEMYALGRKHGLFDHSFVSEELTRSGRAKGDLSTEAGRAAGAKAGLDVVKSKGAGLLRKGVGAAKKAYQDEDHAVRLAYFIDAIERRGLSPEKAAGEAKKWIPTYDDMSGFTRTFSKLGPPFFAYTAAVLPQVGKAITKNPVRFMAAGTLAYAMGQLMFSEEVPEEVLPPEMRGPLSRFPVPKGVKSAAKVAFPSFVPVAEGPDSRTYLDATYTMPWGDIAEGRGASETRLPGIVNPMSNPVLSTLSELDLTGANQEAFTGQPIVEPWMNARERTMARLQYLGRKHLPTATPFIGYGAEKVRKAIEQVPNARGEVRSVRSAVADAGLGMKQRVIDPSAEHGRRVTELVDEIRSNEDEIRSIASNQSIPPDRRQEMIDEHVRRIRVIAARVQTIQGLRP